MATRVFELARELDVTSKKILDKCRAEGLELKNHMATLSAGLEATIREWFSESANVSAVETAEHVDLEQARKEARRTRRRKAEEPASVQIEEPAQEAAEEAAAAEPEQQEAVAVEPATVAEQPVEPAEAAPVAEEPQPAGADEQPLPVAQAPSAVEPAVQQEQVVEEQAPGEDASAKPQVKPAGPQLVPRPAKLQGPRVVRVERPDFIQAPPRRRPATSTTSPAGVAPAAVPVKKDAKPAGEEEESQDKKAKRRSPRRRGGRSADSGETLREWRNRDLEERSERLAAATGGSLRRHRASVAHPALHPAASRGGRIQVEEPITVKSLSAATGIKATAIIRKLMEMGVLATVNQALDRETAEAVVVDYNIELEVARAKTAEEQVLEKLAARPAGELVSRAPVVTFLGHVDHGKTSLLDRIRNASVASGEAGGITQHIGAYRYDAGGKNVVFLDTPGHEAFTAMRARGANMTDVVVLVVAADDGVMPQTVEALSHAKAAKVPIVVALNKIDVPNANVQRALGQLAEHNLNPREWGGDVEVIRTSAISGQGIDELLETLSLEAELLELRAEIDAPASGFVIEAQMSPGLGVLARLLVRNGTLKVGDVLLAGNAYGRVRQMLDSHGRAVSEAGPSTPVEVAGLDEIPEAGDKFYILDDIEAARSVAQDHRQRARSESLAASPPRTLEGLLTRIEEGSVNELALIVKADVQGSAEALVSSLAKLSADEVRVNVLHAGVGGISTGDVMLAEASDALIIGFNVVADAAARQMAEQNGVEIRLYRIIYNVIEDIRKALEEGLAPEVKQTTMGHAEVRQTFKVSRVGTIAGCFVTDGMVQRNAKVRIVRNNVVIEDERSLESLKRFKDDVREVRNGFECGIKIAGYDDIKEGDVLEFYQQVEVARTLSK